MNQVRGLLAERGIVIAHGITRLKKHPPVIIEDEGNALTPLSREGRREVYDQCVALDERMANADRRVRRVFAKDAQCQQLAQVEGNGPVVTTTVAAAVGNAREFAKGRHLAAWLGLVPRQSSSGGKERLLGISKRGDRYLRKLLVHGARATLCSANLKHDRRSQWIRALIARRGTNRAVVALVSENARIVWVLLTTDQVYAPAVMVA